MGRKKKPTGTDGEYLIPDLLPENIRQIRNAVRAYERAEGERKKAKEKKDQYKEKIIELVYAAGVNPVDGVYRIRVGDDFLEVSERDPIIKLKPADGAGGEAETEE